MRTLLDLVAIKQDLEDLLGRPVHVVTTAALQSLLTRGCLEGGGRSVKSDAVYLRHILDAISKIETYVSVGRERFMAESQWHDAVIRQLEIIGEATKKLSLELRSAYPETPWRRIGVHARRRRFTIILAST